MFEEMVVSSAKGKKTNKPWTVFISMVLQVLLLAVLILIPLIYTEALPKTLMSSILLAPPPPPPPPPPPAPVQVVHVKPTAHLMEAGKLVAPKAIPKDIKIIKEEEAPPDVGAGMVGGVPGGVAGGSMGGVIGGVIGGASSTAAPPPPKVTPKRITVGGNVQAAHLVNRVQPTYPPLARQTRNAAPSSFTPSSVRMVPWSSCKWFPVIPSWCSPRSTLLSSGVISPLFSTANRSKWIPKSTSFPLSLSRPTGRRDSWELRAVLSTQSQYHSCWFR